MEDFVDEIDLTVSSGHGGRGCVSFRRERCVPMGGPDGGDGGRGGSVIFKVRENLKTFSHLRKSSVLAAKNGQHGMGRRIHGHDGFNLVIEVPLGTHIVDVETGCVLHEFNEVHEVWTFLHGGRGGKGNWHFKSSRNRAPRYAQQGEGGVSRLIRLEMSLFADIGLLGFPNAGKSSFIRAITNSNSKVGSYPFTTKIPHLGALDLGWRRIVLADIPGIVKGASEGVGLGLQFLRHIKRTKGLAFLIDGSEGDYIESFEILKGELEAYDGSLLSKERVIILTKQDLWDEDSRRIMLSKYSDERVLAFSSFTGRGFEEVKRVFEKIS